MKNQIISSVGYISIAIYTIILVSSCSDETNMIMNPGTSKIDLTNTYEDSKGFEFSLSDMAQSYELGTKSYALDPFVIGDSLINEEKYVNLICNLTEYPNVTFKDSYPQDLKAEDYVFYSGKTRYADVSFIIGGIPGIWNASAYIVSQDTIFAKAQRKFIVSYPEVSDISQNCTSDINSLWEETQNAANKQGRQEKGCWIYAKIRNEELDFTFGDIESGPFVPYEDGSKGEITPSAIKNTYPTNYDEIEKGKYAVAYIHAHTTLSKSPVYLQRDTGLSKVDESYADRHDIPVFAIDYVNSFIDNSTDEYAPFTTYKSKENRRYENYFKSIINY